jgi:hypothetical protein
MNTTYHLNSAQEASNDIIDAIKNIYKSKAITITVEEDETNELNDGFKAILDSRLEEDEATYLTAEESILQLKNKYEL